MSEMRDKIIGHRILGYKLSDDKTELTLVLIGGDVTLYAHGDCCSSSWFEGVSGEEALEDAIITSFSMIDMDQVKNRDPEDDYSVTQQYGIKIITTKGYCDIDMRNESNGYYGGYISLSPDRYQFESEVRGGDNFNA